MNPAGAAIDRRVALSGLLAALAALPVSIWPRTGQAAAALDRASFLEVSTKLCGVRLKGGSLADTIQAALIEQGATPERLARLADLIASAPKEDVERLVAASDVKDLADRLLAVWYTGTTGAPGQERVLTHEDAAAWRATGYAKAPGTCGEFGDWTGRPATAPTGEARR